MTTTDKAWTRTLAILTVGAASLALAGCSLLGNLGGGSTPEETTGAGDPADVFTIKVGDCLNDGSATGEVSEVPTVDCAEPHDSEAYASIIIDDGDFPGDEALVAQAEAECGAAFSDFVGIDFESSSLSYAYYYPTESSWASGDREILCLIVDPAGQTTGSLQGTAK